MQVKKTKNSIFYFYCGALKRKTYLKNKTHCLILTNICKTVSLMATLTMAFVFACLEITTVASVKLFGFVPYVVVLM